MGNLWGVGRKLLQPEDLNIPDVVGRSHRALVIWRPLGGTSKVMRALQVGDNLPHGGHEGSRSP